MALGWISLHRKIKDHWLWKDPVKFQWFIDILLTVNHEDIKVNLGNQIISCKRGQSLRSLQTWAEGWKTNKSMVRRFFVLLESDSIIVTENVQKTTRLTVCNYDSYQSLRNDDETMMKRKRNADETRATPNNNVNNINNENKVNKEPVFDYSEFLNLLNSVKGQNFKGDKKSRPAFEARIKDGYTKDQFLTAIINCYNDPHHQENPNFLTPEFITRSDKLEMYLNYTPKKPGQKTTAAPPAADYKKKAAEQKNKEYK